MINAYAARVMRRLAAAGDHTHQVEDVRQELWIGWCRADDNFNSQLGVPFAAYMQNGIRMQVNDYLRKQLTARISEVHALSLDAPNNGEDDLVLHNVLPSADPSPSAKIEEDSQFAAALARLKPRAQLFLQLLRTQPEELLQQVRQITAQVEQGRKVGIKTATPQRLTANLIFDVMGATRTERTRIMVELERLGRHTIRALSQ